MLNRLRVYLSFVRFSHSVFALPFALAGALLAARHAPMTLARRSAGFSWRWWRRAARRWDSTGSSTRGSTRSTRGPPAASCRAAR